MNNFQYGEHLYVARPLYQHHGIYVGGNSVIHYLRGGIVLTELQEFSNGDPIHKISHPDADYAKAVDRAYSRLFENRYDLIFNNCESFVNWCFTGHNISHQVIHWAKTMLDFFR